jgi:hypothetical protein
VTIPSQLLPTRSSRADYARAVHFVLAAPGTTPEHVMDPDYWTHLASGMRVYDRVEIIAADGSFDMEVRCIELDPRGLWARMRPLRVSEGRAATHAPVGPWPDKEGYSVEWGGPHRWRIIRGQDVVARDFPDQASAIDALVNIKAARQPVPPNVHAVRMSDPPAQPVEEPPSEQPAPQPEEPQPDPNQPEEPQPAAKPPLRGAAAASAARKAAA